MNKCIEMSTGTIGAIFTINNVICSGVGSFFSAIALIYLRIKNQHFGLLDALKSSNERAPAAHDPGLAIALVFFFLWLSFAIVLIVGICKRNATLVMCFFVYGVMILIVGLVSTLYSITQLSVGLAITIAILVLLIDSPALFMILMIYNTFRKEIQFQAVTNSMTPLDKCK